MTQKSPGSYINGRTVPFCSWASAPGFRYTLIYLMQAWLAKSGLDVKALGLFGLVMFPYTFKFLWAPFMDRYTVLPLGRGARWMALTSWRCSPLSAAGMLDPKLNCR
jgi:PAT family beta-lactamase induction signal transducer AmpG